MEIPKTGRKRILVVDDNPIDSRLVKLALERTTEYHVKEVNDSTLAVSAAEEFQPHLVLMDVIMPGLDGGQVTAAFDSHPSLKEIPIVFLTATVTQQEVEAGRGLVGGLPFLAKPLVLTELIACIEHYLGRLGALPAAV